MVPVQSNKLVMLLCHPGLTAVAVFKSLETAASSECWSKTFRYS